MSLSSRADPQTLVIWHGYLLGATGSNIYTHHLVDSWVRAGHDVVLACQEPSPDAHPRIHEVKRLARDVSTGEVTVADHTIVREPEPGHGRCTMVVPDIHGLLPVYVLDRYEGFEVVRVPELEPERLASYADDHRAAIQWVIETFEPSGVLINHASPLPAAIGPALEQAGIPYAVKVHGSELEYALVENAELVGPAAMALLRASNILVGSSHIAARTAELLGDWSIEGRTHIVPPGVDLERFHPIERSVEARSAALDRLTAIVAQRSGEQPRGRTQDASEHTRALVAAVGGDNIAAAALIEQLAALHGTYEEREIEAGAADAIRVIDAGDRSLIVFVGKLIPQKGVQVLLAAMPHVLERHPTAQLVVGGFGPLRDALEAMVHAMELGDEAALDLLADRGGELSGEGGEGLPHLRGWLDLLWDRGELADWLKLGATTKVSEHVSWLGLVDHSVLAELWPLAETSIVPSVLAEAFGMVAAEAAACGAVPIVSDHSGLADAASVIELDGVAPIRFTIEEPLGTAVENLAAAMIARLDLDEVERARQAAAARANVAHAWGWDELAVSVATLMTSK